MLLGTQGNGFARNNVQWIRNKINSDIITNHLIKIILNKNKKIILNKNIEVIFIKSINFFHYHYNINRLSNNKKFSTKNNETDANTIISIIFNLQHVVCYKNFNNRLSLKILTLGTEINQYNNKLEMSVIISELVSLVGVGTYLMLIALSSCNFLHYFRIFFCTKDTIYI